MGAMMFLLQKEFVKKNLENKLPKAPSQIKHVYIVSLFQRNKFLLRCWDKRRYFELTRNVYR